MKTLALSCPACGRREVCRPTQMLERLQQLGMFRRTSNPEPEVLEELFRSRLDRMRCGGCHRVGLVAAELVDDEWEDVQRSCQLCGRPIPRERLELLPETQRCAECQQRTTVEETEPAEFCPRCGSAMKLRLSAGQGISRYVWQCTACRRS